MRTAPVVIHRSRRSRISVVGIGIESAGGLTVRARERLRQSQIIFSLVNGCFEPDLSKNIVDLLPLYRDGVRDLENYDAICQKVIASTKSLSEVALVVAGHPRFGVSLVSRLEAAAKSAGVGCEVIPGVSSFDALLLTLKKDALERGSVLIDANRLLLFDLKLETTLDHYIFHVCSVGSSIVHRRAPWRSNQLSLLQAKLLTLYPPHHVIELVRVLKASRRALRTRVPLRDLLAHKRSISFDSTLFVPGVEPVNIDRAFWDLINR